jgi:hypothetical protein
LLNDKEKPMSNPLFVAGQQSPNPSGRPKHSVRSVKGMVERFVRRNMTPNRLSRIFDELSARDQAELLTALLPYVISKQPTDAINQEEIERLHAMLQEALNKEEHGKVG